MILVLFALFFVALLGAIYIDNKCSLKLDWLSGVLGVGGVLGLIVSAIAIVMCSIEVSNLKVIDDKIAMYQEENIKIEEQIATVVSEYQSYEKEIFTTVKPESAMTLIALYPELKSDSLVQKQVEVYISNNNKIKELKEKDISGDVWRWWLYFGGVNKR